MKLLHGNVPMFFSLVIAIIGSMGIILAHSEPADVLVAAGIPAIVFGLAGITSAISGITSAIYDSAEAEVTEDESVEVEIEEK